MKTCGRCKEAKDFDQFSKASNKPDGYQVRCNDCNFATGALRDDPANFDKAKQYILDFRKS